MGKKQSNFAARAVCSAGCGFIEPDVSFGNIWFVDKHYGGVCPECGSEGGFLRVVLQRDGGSWKTLRGNVYDPKLLQCVSAVNADWGHSCGRTYLQVNGIILAMEGDLCRDGDHKLPPRWTNHSIKKAVEIINK